MEAVQSGQASIFSFILQVVEGLLESNKTYPFMKRGFLSGVNCDDVKDGYIRPNGAVSNAPTANGMIVSFSVPEGWCAGQFFFDDYDHLSFRRKWANSWGSWHTIY